MGQKLEHSSREFLIHPGETIAEILEDRNMTQKELAIRTGFTEKHISTVINGMKSISAKLALGLEHALDVPASFWNNLQTNFDLEVEMFNERNNITDEEITIARDIKKPVEVLTKKKLGSTDESHTVIALRHALGMRSLTSIKRLNTGVYRSRVQANQNENIMYVWQYLSEKACLSQTENALDIDRLISSLPSIKKIMFEDPDNHVSLIQKALNQCGILFTVNKHVKGAPIHGLTVKTRNQKLMIAMTVRYKYIDTFWFSLFHEIAHVLHNVYLSHAVSDQTIKTQEKKADAFAQNALIDPELYATFVKARDFTGDAVIDFARKCGVLPTIVVGRLMNDGHKDWNENTLREQYAWIHS